MQHGGSGKTGSGHPVTIQCRLSAWRTMTIRWEKAALPWNWAMMPMFRDMPLCLALIFPQAQAQATHRGGACENRIAGFHGRAAGGREWPPVAQTVATTLFLPVGGL
jgi:hypothetical protein